MCRGGCLRKFFLHSRQEGARATEEENLESSCFRRRDIQGRGKKGSQKLGFVRGEDGEQGGRTEDDGRVAGTPKIKKLWILRLQDFRLKKGRSEQ